MLITKSTRVLATNLTLLILIAVPRFIPAEEVPRPDEERRTVWTTSRITGTPTPPPPFVTERVFPSLQFTNCLDITSAPGSDRLFVVEQSGKILSFANRQDASAADLVVDIAKEIDGAQQVYALTFHPDFERNRYCYVCYVKAAGLEDGTHVARFRMNRKTPPTIDAASERTIITWLSGGHNGCCLKFGPDGYLYVSTGDGVGPNPPDTNRTGQDITDLLSSVLRIDVDHADPDRNYRIPPDNPFVDLPGARGEIWAYGFRNPWRMSFDRETGDLWVGDVGWELWELLDRVQRGGNYGWSVMEGRQPTNPEWPRGPTPILPPTIEHPHSESSSITDGLTYYGLRLKELHGRHIYGDYDTGKIWAFRFAHGQVVEHLEIADTTHRIVAFGEDNHGELYLLDHVAGTVHRLHPNPNRNQTGEFPHQLSETGLFHSVVDHLPAAGVIPYSINAEPWADHAVAERFVAVPGNSTIDASGATWQFPKDAVLAKTISIEMRRGDSDSLRRLETQVLHFDGREWQPYTYRWNDEQTDATLLDASGAEITLEISDPEAPGNKRTQVWRFAGRAECQRCHNRWSGPPLAFNTPQLNRPRFHGDTISQLDELASVGRIEKLRPAEQRPKLSDPRDATANRNDRARAYLHVNCAHCHRKHAGGSVLSTMQFDLPMEQTGMIGARPSQGTFGIRRAQVISPGDPFASVLYYRMCKLGGGRMPHLGSTEVDVEGVALIHQWLCELPANGPPSGADLVTTLRSRDSALAGQLESSPGPHEQSELIRQMLSSTSGALMLLRSVDMKSLPAKTASATIDMAAEHDDVRVRSLFERFLPAEKRIKRLGTVIDAANILSIPGDPGRGRKLFFETASMQCRNCHQIAEVGKDLGPDLSLIGKKYNRAELLESLLEPSKKIDPEFVTYVAETDGGRLVTGLLLKKDANEVVLKNAQNEVIHVAADRIDQLAPQQISLMPDLLLRDMTAQRVADLLAYLSSLK